MNDKNNSEYSERDGDKLKKKGPNSIRLPDGCTSMLECEMAEYRRRTGNNMTLSQYVRMAVTFYMKIPAKLREKILDFMEDLESGKCGVKDLLEGGGDGTLPACCVSQMKEAGLSDEQISKDQETLKSMYQTLRKDLVSSSKTGVGKRKSAGK